MNGADKNNMQQMQRDAEKRIREMQQRADRAVHKTDIPPVPNFVRLSKQPQAKTQNINQTKSFDQPTKVHEKPIQKKGLLSGFKGLDILKAFNFKNLKIDSDVLIIIALIFLLSTEETDELLLLALVYIML